MPKSRKNNVVNIVSSLKSTYCSLGKSLKIRQFFSRFLTYTKLFLGFGFMWTFEIISGLAADSTSKSDW